MEKEVLINESDILCISDGNLYPKDKLKEFDIILCESDDNYYKINDNRITLCSTDKRYYLYEDENLVFLRGKVYLSDDDDIVQLYNDSYELRENSFLCEKCDNYFHQDYEHYVENWGSYCESCYNDDFITCHRCNESINIRNDCYYHIYDRGYNVCEDCLDRYCHCDECDEYYHSECRCSERRNHYIGHYHSHKGTEKFKRLKTESKKIECFGVEIEVESDLADLESTAKYITENWDLFYCESDGSLNRGFEIISHPFTFGYFRKEGKKIFKTLLKSLLDRKFTSYKSSRCGIHVHVTKKNFSSLDIYKLYEFFRRESYFISSISQRKGKTSYCNKVSEKQVIKTIAKSKGYYERYLEINTSNTKTIEFRLFRGTLKYESFLKDMEFIFALCEFVKVCSLTDLYLGKFKEFILRNPKRYRNLLNFIERNS